MPATSLTESACMTRSGAPRRHRGAARQLGGGGHRDAGTNRQSMLVRVEVVPSPQGAPTAAQSHRDGDDA